jgi:hypothetical protein
MKKEPTWVDLPEAIRITVRLMFSDGEQLAALIDDRWITEGGDHYPSEEYTDGNLDMIERYGKNWWETRERVIAAYKNACATLKDILSQALIAGECNCGGEIGRRAVTEREWEDRNIVLPKSMLSRSRYFPAITGVVVKAADVRRECKKAIAPSNAEGLAKVTAWLPAPDQKFLFIKPDGDGYMPVLAAVHWIASEGHTIDLDICPDAANRYRKAMEELSDLKILKIEGVDQNGKHGTIPPEKFATLKWRTRFIFEEKDLWSDALDDDTRIVLIPYDDDHRSNDEFWDGGNKFILNELVVLKESVRRTWPFLMPINSAPPSSDPEAVGLLTAPSGPGIFGLAPKDAAQEVKQRTDSQKHLINWDEAASLTRPLHYLITPDEELSWHLCKDDPKLPLEQYVGLVDRREAACKDIEARCRCVFGERWQSVYDFAISVSNAIVKAYEKSVLERQEWEAARPDRTFNRRDWDVWALLSWVVFRDRAKICSFENQHSWRLWVKYDSTSEKREPSAVIDEVLDALSSGDLEAIRDGVPLLCQHWFGRYYNDLMAGAYFFDRDNVLEKWSDPNSAGTPRRGAKTGPAVKAAKEAADNYVEDTIERGSSPDQQEFVRFAAKTGLRAGRDTLREVYRDAMKQRGLSVKTGPKRKRHASS